ncbi:MAG: M23 family metallopeptidase, partial [Myxococcota bacterium]|nr:M23 family metallopeptidase [Myxococcota bacterium]
MTCEPTIQAYPVAGPHNGGYDINALDYTCHPHPSASPDNSDWIAGQHFGNDLFAAKGTPAVSPVDGTIYNFGATTVGGNRVTVQGPCGWLYYHAHFDTIEPGLWVGMPVSAGQLIGTVGNTGNAIGTSPHIHFSIYPPGDYEAGVDPFPYLEQADSTACEGGTVDPPPPEPTPTEPDLGLSVFGTPPEGQPADFRPEGSSAGITDLYEGQSATVEILVHNDASGAGANGVVVGVAFVGGAVSPVSWAIYSDHPAYDQVTWIYNDANDHPSNPDHDAPPVTGAWHMHAFSPGETKRLVFDVVASSYSIGTQPRPEVQAWVWHVDDWYGEQTAWDDPVETN